MPGIDEVLRKIKTLRPPIQAAGMELKSLSGPVTALDAWGLMEAVRLFVQLPPGYGTCIERLEAFVQNPKPLAFTKLDRGQVGVELLTRLCNHSVINQNIFGICGPAAMAMDIAKNRPVEYVKIATQLADEGQSFLGHLKLMPNPQILSYDPQGSMPQADWIVCASIRNEETNIEKEFAKQFYGGSSVDEVFDWMVKAGYRKVIGVSHRALAKCVKVSPPEMKPAVLDPSDRNRGFETAMDLLGSGWHLLLGCYKSILRDGIERMSVAQKMADDTEEPSFFKDELSKVAKALNTQPPGVAKRLIETGLALTIGRSPEEEAHWIYVEKMARCSLDKDLLTVTICSHGVRHNGVNVPLDGFRNKYFGFVAVTDLG